MSFTCGVRGATNQPLTVRPQELPPGFRAEITEPEQAAPVKYVRVIWEPPGAAEDRAAYPQLVTLNFVAVDGTTEYPVTVRVECSNPR